MMEVLVSTPRQGYIERIDLEEYDLLDEPMSFTKPLRPFKASSIDQFNGNHFIFGWFECFSQSDDVPMWLREATSDELTIEFRYGELNSREATSKDVIVLRASIPQSRICYEEVTCEFEKLTWDQVKAGDEVYYLAGQRAHGPFLIIDPKTRKIRNRYGAEWNVNHDALQLVIFLKETIHE